tara:strand:- start:4808 stop:5128 length:321 start_codon:yes stop_codon:yes gene_type:complete
MNMKRLKPSTIKRYNARQLLRHLDRLQDKYFLSGRAPYRIDQYQVYSILGGAIRKPYVRLGRTLALPFDDLIVLRQPAAYYPFCDLHDRDMIIEAIESTYRKLGSK